jgi:signal peptidase
MGKFMHRAKRTILFLAVLLSLVLLGLSLPIAGRQALSVQSGSMEPAIRTGSLLFLQPIEASRIRVGDIITYRDPRNQTQTITHRVQEIRQAADGYILMTKGDANPVPDRPITDKRVVGKVGPVIPYLGRVIDVLRHPLAVLFIIWLPTLGLVVGETKRLSTYYRRLKPYLAPGIQSRLFTKRRSLTPMALFIASASLIMVVTGASVPVVGATIYDQVRLTGNTISVRSKEPQGPAEPDPGTTISCTNTTHVQINGSTYQSAVSGAAEVNNTTGGSATTGSASNSNSTSLNINLQTGACAPATPTR